MEIVYDGHLLTAHQKYDIKDKALSDRLRTFDKLIIGTFPF